MTTLHCSSMDKAKALKAATKSYIIYCLNGSDNHFHTSYNTLWTPTIHQATRNKNENRERLQNSVATIPFSAAAKKVKKHQQLPNVLKTPSTHARKWRHSMMSSRLELDDSGLRRRTSLFPLRQQLLPPKQSWRPDLKASRS